MISFKSAKQWNDENGYLCFDEIRDNSTTSTTPICLQHEQSRCVGNWETSKCHDCTVTESLCPSWSRTGYQLDCHTDNPHKEMNVHICVSPDSTTNPYSIARSIVVVYIPPQDDDSHGDYDKLWRLPTHNSGRSHLGVGPRTIGIIFTVILSCSLYVFALKNWKIQYRRPVSTNSQREIVLARRRSYNAQIRIPTNDTTSQEASLSEAFPAANQTVTPSIDIIEERHEFPVAVATECDRRHQGDDEIPLAIATAVHV